MRQPGAPNAANWRYFDALGAARQDGHEQGFRHGWMAGARWGLLAGTTWGFLLGGLAVHYNVQRWLPW